VLRRLEGGDLHRQVHPQQNLSGIEGPGLRTPPHTVSADAVTVEFTGASTAAVSRRAGVWFDDEAEGAA